MSGTLPSTAVVERLVAACRDVPVTLQIARFRGTADTTELHVIAQPTAQASFVEQIDWLARACDEAAERAGVPRTNVVFRRLFCSDIANQVGGQDIGSLDALWPAPDAGVVSWVGQAPPAPASVAMWAYFVADDAAGLHWTGGEGAPGLRRDALTHYWTAGLHASPPAFDAPSTATQTAAILDAYIEQTHAAGMTLGDNVLRTWFYVRDIDADYGAFVAARRGVFAAHGLTPHTHYIASTGIEGTPSHPDVRVTLDAYAIAGISADQITYLRAPEYLCPTDAYGVTFERGTMISYRDRRHVLVSGTASIDRAGNLLHPGDVARQANRTLDNIGALLNAAGGDVDSLCHLIAYVRDAADEPVVRTTLRQRCGDVPLLIVRGAVCRPGWLVEIEGQAIVANNEPHHPRL